MLKKLVRCRECDECLRAKQFHWARRGVAETAHTAQLGGRTWFGTLTLSDEAQQTFIERAKLASDEDPNAEFWSDPMCDHRFKLVRDQLLLECRRMWARLRKQGHKFSYMLVFERHLGGGVHHGLPHIHYLLHEKGEPIRKKVLADAWPWGFTKIKIVGGSAKNSPDPEQAAFYVAKYLGKHRQARQIASKSYGDLDVLNT